jgi:hypothetical protein
MQQEPMALLPRWASTVPRLQLETREERCALGGSGHAESDPDLFVERLHERDLAILVPLGEGCPESVERVIAYDLRQLDDVLDSARDLIDNRTAERCPRRLREVELEQPRGLRLRGLILEDRLDAAIFRRRGTQTSPIQLLE